MAIDLQIENISKSFGDLVLFNDISFTVEERQRIGLIACNGKGKSTLLKVIAGEEPYEGGRITLRNDIRVGYLEQEPDFDGELTVIKACLQRNAEKAEVIAQYEAAIEADDHAQLQHLMEEMDRLQAWDYENRAKQVLTKLKIKNFNQPIKELSGGQKRRAAMAGVLVMRPGILVLDEPASGLDPKGRQEMFAIIKGLRDSGTTIILVSHNMDEAAVNCDRICLIDNGKIKAVGTPAELFVKKRADELKVQLPRITRFSAVLRTELAEIYPDIEFKGNYFNPEKEAKVIVSAVCEAGDHNA